MSSRLRSGGAEKALEWDAAAPAPGALLGEPLQGEQKEGQEGERGRLALLCCFV